MLLFELYEIRYLFYVDDILPANSESNPTKCVKCGYFVVDISKQRNQSKLKKKKKTECIQILGF